MSLADRRRARREGQEQTTEEVQTSTSGLAARRAARRSGTTVDAPAPESATVVENTQPKQIETEVTGKIAQPETKSEGFWKETWNYATNPGEFNLDDIKEGMKSASRNVALTPVLMQVGVARKARRNHQARMLKIHGPDFDLNTDAQKEMFDNEVATAENRLKSVMAVEWLKENPREGDGWIGDLLRMGPQFAAQIAITVATGPVGGGVFMGTQIMSSTAAQAIEAGADPERALMAGTAAAIVSAPLEQLGLGKAAKFLPLKKGILKKLKDLSLNISQEGLTELLQAIPDHAANIFAEDSDLSMLEALDKTLSDPEEVAKLKKEMAQAAVAGSIMGSASGFAGVVADNTREAQTEPTPEVTDEPSKKPKKKQTKPKATKTDTRTEHEKRKEADKKKPKPKPKAKPKKKEELAEADDNPFGDKATDAEKKGKDLADGPHQELAEASAEDKAKAVLALEGIEATPENLAKATEAIKKGNKNIQKKVEDAKEKEGKGPNYFEFPDGTKLRGQTSGEIYNRANAKQKKQMKLGKAVEGFTDKETGTDVPRYPQKTKAKRRTAATHTQEGVDKAIEEAGIDRAKVKTVKKTVMTGEEFLDLTTASDTRKEGVKKKAEEMAMGKAPVTEGQPMLLVVDKDGNVVGHDGRHRAARAGDGEVDVVVISEEELASGKLGIKPQKFGTKQRLHPGVEVDLRKNPWAKPKTVEDVASKATQTKLNTPSIKVKGKTFYAKTKMDKHVDLNNPTEKQAQQILDIYKELTEQARAEGIDFRKKDIDFGWDLEGKHVSTKVLADKLKLAEREETATKERIKEKQDVENRKQRRQKDSKDTRSKRRKYLAQAHKSGIFDGKKGRALQQSVKSAATIAAKKQRNKAFGKVDKDNFKDFVQAGQVAIIEKIMADELDTSIKPEDKLTTPGGQLKRNFAINIAKFPISKVAGEILSGGQHSGKVAQDRAKKGETVAPIQEQAIVEGSKDKQKTAAPRYIPEDQASEVKKVDVKQHLAEQEAAKKRSEEEAAKKAAQAKEKAKTSHKPITVKTDLQTTRMQVIPDSVKKVLKSESGMIGDHKGKRMSLTEKIRARNKKKESIGNFETEVKASTPVYKKVQGKIAQVQRKKKQMSQADRDLLAARAKARGGRTIREAYSNQAERRGDYAAKVKKNAEYVQDTSDEIIQGAGIPAENIAWSIPTQAEFDQHARDARIWQAGVQELKKQNVAPEIMATLDIAKKALKQMGLSKTHEVTQTFGPAIEIPTGEYKTNPKTNEKYPEIKLTGGYIIVEKGTVDKVFENLYGSTDAEIVSGVRLMQR
jgi:hypothetical protein